MASFPGFERLYYVDDPFAKAYLRGDITFDGDAFALTRGEVRPSAPVSVTWGMGGQRPADFVWTTSLSPLLMHARVHEMLRNERFTGWTTYPVNLTGKNGTPYPDYVGLAITGRCAAKDLSRSDVVVRQYPGGWYPELQGHYFNEASWTGDDLFMESPAESGSLTAFMFVTERVVQAAWKAKLTNVSLTRLVDVSVPVDTYDTPAGRERLPPNFASRVREAYRSAGVPRPKRWVD